MSSRRFAAERLVGSVLLLAVPPAAGQPYRDIAPAAGLAVITGVGSPDKNHIVESTGVGVAALDYDQDGLPDLYFPNAPAWDAPDGAWRFRSGALYRNRGDGTFADVTESAGLAVPVFGQGAVSGDIDNDGFPDLLVTAVGPNQFFRNNGDGTFREIGAALGLDDPGWGIGAAFLDADGDGWLDLFVANYIRVSPESIRAGRRTRRWRGRVPALDGPRGLPPEANRFHRSREGRVFEDASAVAFAAIPPRYSMGVAVFDLDDDADPDIFVANDSAPNALLRNEGDGVFTDVGLLAGVALSGDGASQGSMGVAAADPDGDGIHDLIVTNFAHDHYTWYRGVGPQLFLDDSMGAGLALPTFAPLGWGALFFDADNDGDLDLALANGHIYPQVDDDPLLGESYRQPDLLMERRATEFLPVALGGPVRSSRGMALLDVEGDGALEIAVSNQDDPPTLLRRAARPPGGWMRVRLADPEGNRDGIGARVKAAGRFAALVSGGSYASDSERVLHFGFGAGTAPAVPVRVRWPDGAVESHPGLEPGRAWLLRRGAAPLPLR